MYALSHYTYYSRSNLERIVSKLQVSDLNIRLAPSTSIVPSSST